VAFSHLSHLECSRTGERYDADVVQGTSRVGAPLLARYDLDAVAATVTPDDVAARPPDLWRYHELLPVRDHARVVTLGEGMTPLLPLPRAGARLGVPRLLMKDEGLVPTGAFKARGAAVGVSRAAELGVTGIAMPTNGNAGAAWSAYAARAGLRSLVAMPVDAPEITRRECVVTGAELYLVDGLIGDAGRLVNAAVTARGGLDAGWQETSTLKEPYRIEGKKTMGLEIAEQLSWFGPSASAGEVANALSGQDHRPGRALAGTTRRRAAGQGWRLPDVILYPTGGGVGIIAIHKALLELRELGWVTGDLPRLVAVQAEGCAPIVDAFHAGLDESTAPAQPRTVAFGITVPKALGDFLVLDAVRSTGGTAIAVSDADLLEAEYALARDEGTWICPEGAACVAAVGQLRESGWLSGDEEVVVLNTGTGLIYPDTVVAEVPTLSVDGVIPS
jgi:threonine synthase